MWPSKWLKKSCQPFSLFQHLRLHKPSQSSQEFDHVPASDQIVHPKAAIGPTSVYNTHNTTPLAFFPSRSFARVPTSSVAPPDGSGKWWLSGSPLPNSHRPSKFWLEKKWFWQVLTHQKSWVARSVPVLTHLQGDRFTPLEAMLFEELWRLNASHFHTEGGENQKETNKECFLFKMLEFSKSLRRVYGWNMLELRSDVTVVHIHLHLHLGCILRPPCGPISNLKGQCFFWPWTLTPESNSLLGSPTIPKLRPSATRAPEAVAKTPQTTATVAFFWRQNMGDWAIKAVENTICVCVQF